MVSVGALAAALLLAVPFRAASQENTVRIQKAAGLSARMVYWFARPDRAASERHPLPAPDRNGVISLGVPAAYWSSESSLKVLDLGQRRIARIAVQSRGERGVLGGSLLRTGDFTLGSEGWKVTVENTGRAETGDEFPPAGVPGMAARIRVLTAAGVPEHVAFVQQDLDLKEGEPYTLSFWARADTPRPITVQSQCVEGEGPAQTTTIVGLDTRLRLTKEWRKFTLVFTASHTQPDRERIAFLLGAATGAVDIAGARLQHGRIGRAPGPSVLANGDFSREGDGWFPVATGGQPKVQLAFPAREDIAPPTGASGKVVRLTVLPIGKGADATGLCQAGCDLRDNTAYTVSFWGKASKDRSLQVVVRADRDDSRALAMANTVTVTEDWRHFSFIFVASQTVRNGAQLELLAGDQEGTIDLADVALQPGIGDSSWNETDAQKPSALTAADFQYADIVRAPVTYRGRGVRDVVVSLSADGVEYGRHQLKPSDNGVARFADAPLNKPLVFAVTRGTARATFTRSLGVGPSRIVPALALPASWSQVAVLGQPSARLVAHPLLGAWETFVTQDTLIGQEFQHSTFTFLADETGALETTSLNKETEAPTGAPRQETFRWNVAPGSHRITLGTNTYTWQITNVEQLKQLTLKSDTGKTYTLFRN